MQGEKLENLLWKLYRLIICSTVAFTPKNPSSMASSSTSKLENAGPAQTEEQHFARSWFQNKASALLFLKMFRYLKIACLMSASYVLSNPQILSFKVWIIPLIVQPVITQVIMMTENYLWWWNEN